MSKARPVSVGDSELVFSYHLSTHGYIYLPEHIGYSENILCMCESSESGIAYVCKRIEKHRVSDLNQVALHHSGISKIKEIIKGDTWNYMILELARFGDLEMQMSVRKLPLPLVRSIVAQLVLAVEYIHSKGIIHRDLKPRNVLIDSTLHVKVSDFGLSKACLPEYTHTICGTPFYMAPEVIMGYDYGPDVDWWALGIILYRLCLDSHPFGRGSSDPLVIYDSILRDQLIFPDSCSLPLIDLISRLLTRDPESRIKVSSLKSHPWFTGVNWETLHVDLVPDGFDFKCSSTYHNDGSSDEEINASQQALFEGF